MRYRFRTLMIVLALGPMVLAWYGPAFYELALDSIWLLTGHTHRQSIHIKETIGIPGGEIIANGKSYGHVEPGEWVSLKSRGRVYVDGKPRQLEEP